MYDQWFTIALLALEFGQVWAKQGLQNSHTTLGEIVRLHNCAVADKGSIDEYYGDLGKSGQSMCVMTSRHSCGEDQMANGSIQGDNCNKDVTSR